MSSPWAKIAQPEPINLEEIMSEELARDLQSKEDKKYFEMLDTNKTGTAEAIPIELLENTENSDEVIAQMLQQQYDKEYDEMLKRTENKMNGTSKVSVSFENYRRAPKSFDFESDSEEEEIVDINDRKDWDRFDELERQFTSFPPCGYKMYNGKMITKHDHELCGKKNACKMLSFPPEFQTGDGEGFDMKLSNKVFNSLKVHSKQEQARRHRMRDKKEDQATAVFGMDEFTRLRVYKMINKQLLERVNGVISIGKEAVVLHADGDASCPDMEVPKECCIKIFKTTVSEFKHRDKYMREDHRFKDRMKGTRGTAHLWAEKEMANLTRLSRVGIPCPQVVQLKAHILVMSFIGDNHRPAPKLKDAILDDAELIVVYDEIIELMKTMYSQANLIHTDLSEYNILWHEKEKKCYIIDVSQSVEPTHITAFDFLLRDCGNIINFFDRKGVPELPSPSELFISITGFDHGDRISMEAIQEQFKMKPHLVDQPGIEPIYNFDTAWAKSQADKLTEKNDIVVVEPPKA